MLIDTFLPDFNLTAKEYSIEINASIEEVYPVVRKLDLRGSYLTRFIFFMRSIPALLHGQPAIGLTLDDMDKMGFFLLAEGAPHELLVGFVGKIWTSSGDLQKVAPADFCAFSTPGYLKGVMGFTLTALSEGRTRVTTVTRVQTLCEESLRKIEQYWFFMEPISGAVRRGMLRACKRQAEGKCGRLFSKA